MTITEDQLEAWIRQLIKENKLEKFYKWREWRELSEQIKKENNYECQLCKKRGIHTPCLLYTSVAQLGVAEDDAEQKDE